MFSNTQTKPWLPKAATEKAFLLKKYKTTPKNFKLSLLVFNHKQQANQENCSFALLQRNQVTRKRSLHCITGVVWYWSSVALISGYCLLALLASPGALCHIQLSILVTRLWSLKKAFFKKNYTLPPIFFHTSWTFLPTALPGGIILLPVVGELWTPTLLPSLPATPPPGIVSVFCSFSFF